MTAETLPLPVFVTSLRWHDWWHEMSDDHTAWSAGLERERELRAISKQSDKHARLFELAEKYHRALKFDYDNGLNWARAVLAVNGIRATDNEISDLIEPKGSRLYNRDSDGFIHWDMLDEHIASRRT